MNVLVSLLQRARLIILLVTVALAVGAAFLLPRLRIETNLMNFLPPDDIELGFFKETGQVFGGNYIGMAALEADDVLSAPALVALRDVTRTLQQVPGVASVLSLSNVMDIQKTADGIAVTELLPEDPASLDPAALAALRTRILASEQYTSAFVTPDAKTAAVMVRLRPDTDEESVARAMRAACAEHWTLGAVHLAGFPVVMEYLFSALLRDMKVLTALVALAILGVLFVSFRVPRGVILPLVTVSLSTLGAFAAMALSGTPATVISAVVPVVLFSTGTAYTIHLLNAVHQEYAEGVERWEALRRALSKVGVAIVLSGLTTVFGFLALMSSPLLLFVDFGLYVAVGVAVALVLSLTVMPVVISFLPSKPPRADAEHRHPVTDRLLGGLARLVHAHPAAVVLTAVLSALGGSVGMLKLRGDMDVFGVIGEHSPPRQAQDFITREFGGTTPLSVHVRADLKDPLVLGELLNVEKHLRNLPRVSSVASVADVIAEMNQKLNGLRAVPSSREGVASLWLLLEGNDMLRQLVTESEDRGMIQGRIDEQDNLSRNRLVDEINALLRAHGREQLVRVQRVTLDDAARTRLASLAADDMLERLGQDLAFRQLTLKDPSTLRAALLAQQSRPLAAPPLERRRNLIDAYLGAEDCDIEIDDRARIPELAAALAALDAPGEEVLARTLVASLPALAEDAEGVQLAARAMQRRLDEDSRHRELGSLLSHVRAEVAPAAETWTPSLEQDLRADLSGVFEDGWVVTPAQARDLLGAEVDASTVSRLELHQTGLPVMGQRLDSQLVRSQVISLIVALVTVFALLVVQMRSLVGSLISIMPIVLTLLVNFGTMGLLGISVNPGTMMIAALAIGIGIDYTIHVVTRLRVEARHGLEGEALLVTTLQTTGRAVLINVASVALGFVVLAASQLVIMQQFGLLVAYSMLLCGLGAVTVIPALVILLKPSFLRRNGQAQDA
ncbi:MAG: MMPL family transporter [Pseudomonadota bacterium]